MSIPVRGGLVEVVDMPVPDGSEPTTSSYLLVPDSGPPWIVDPGAASEQGEEVLERALARHGRRFEEVGAIVVSHLHRDHAGLVPAIARRTGAPVLVHADELAELRSADDPHGWAAGRRARLRGWGVPEADVDGLVGRPHVAAPWTDVRVIELHDGVPLPIPGIPATVLHLPGHTSGSIGIHLVSESLLISGDLLLPHRATGVGLGGRERPGMIAALLASLDRVERLDPRRIAPGHGRPAGDVPRLVSMSRERIGTRVEAAARSMADDPERTTWQRARALPWSTPWERMDATRRRAALTLTAHVEEHVTARRGSVSARVT